jgi:carotenoid cleavage dioxygenase-like enzyme
MSTATDPNRFVSGLLAPIEHEVTATDLAVRGTLPVELDGRYLRNGPNPIAPVPEGQHWFVGPGMIHGLRLRDGRAEWYRNRYVRSGGVADQLGEADPGGPLHDENRGPVNTNVVGIGGRTFAVVEAGSFPVELTHDLDTIGSSDFDGTLTTSFSAHPKVDPATGELHTMTYYWPEDSVHYVVVSPDAKVIHDAEIPVGGKPMVHDTAITETRALVLDLPCTFSLDAAMGGSQLPYAWDPERPARIGVLPLHGGADDVVWCSIDPCYVFHPLNAHDLPDGRIEAVVARHPRMFDGDQLGPNDGPPTLERWLIDPASGTVKEERIDDRGQEFPRVPEALVGRKARYGYTVGFSSPFATYAPLFKHDLDAGTSSVHDFGPTSVPGEAVFVPRDGATAEDDGWLLTIVTDSTTERSALHVVSAQDFGADSVAVVDLPQRVPLGFHGNWIPSSQ